MRRQAFIAKRLKARAAAAAGGAAKKPTKKKQQQPPPPPQSLPPPQAAITVDSAVELSLAEYASGLVRAALNALREMTRDPGPGGGGGIAGTADPLACMRF